MNNITAGCQRFLLACVAAYGTCAWAQQNVDNDLPDPAVSPRVDTYRLESFLPSAEQGEQFVDAGSAMPAQFIHDTLPDFMGRQWTSVVRTYWSYPIPGNGPLPAAGGGMQTLLGNFENHVEGAIMAHPAGAGQLGTGAFWNVASTFGTYPLAILSAVPPLGSAIGAIGNTILNAGSFLIPNLAAIAGSFGNFLTDWAPGLPPVYQVSIDYFKVGVSQPAFANDMHSIWRPVRQTVGDTAHQTFGPIREEVGSTLKGIFGPVRSLVKGAVDQGIDSFKGALANFSGKTCRLSYAEKVAQAWPPAMEAGFDCGGVTKLRMYVDVGANFKGAGAGYMPLMYDPFSGDWSTYLGLSPSSVFFAFLPNQPLSSPIWYDSATGQWVSYVGASTFLPYLAIVNPQGGKTVWYDTATGQWYWAAGLEANLLQSVIAPFPYTLQPKESLVVTIDSLKNRDDLHRLAQSINYHGLCMAVHPDGEGCQ